MSAVGPGPDGKRDLWVCWWTAPVFYMLFGVIFVLLAHVMPPPQPWKSTTDIVTFFDDHRTTIQIGFTLLTVVIAGAAVLNGLVAYQMRRMSVKPVFAYGYIATLSVGAIPGCLLCAISFLTATFRPERDPHQLALLYDVAFLSFVGSLGCFAAQYLILAIAILLDKNRIFPPWMAYISIWQVVTELLAAPVFIYKHGPFAWNGAIAFYEGTVLFGVYIACLIPLLRRAIQQQPVPERLPA